MEILLRKERLNILNIMFDLLNFNKHIAVITDRNEVLTYAQLAEEVENFAVHYKGGLVFTLCENLLGSFVGYVACMNKHIPQVLLDGSKDLELVQRLIGIYQPEYIWTPSDRVQEVSNGFKEFKVIYEYKTYSLIQTGFASQEINSELQLCLTTSGSTGSPKLVRLS